jgi:hypothetical protein
MINLSFESYAQVKNLLDIDLPVIKADVTKIASSQVKQFIEAEMRTAIEGAGYGGRGPQ